MEQEALSISNICGGAVEEVFAREMGIILANIADQNTNPEATRALTLEFKIKPFKDRSGAQIEFACKSKMAGVDTVKGTMFLQRRGTALVAVPHDPRQSRLFNPAAVPEGPDKKLQ